jgi:CHAD domain-containing protein
MAKAVAVQTPLHRFEGEKVGELCRWVPLALRYGDREGVHQARVTTRRLKAALDLLRPALVGETRRKFAKILRRLRRSLGPLRDVDVMLGHLGEVGPDGKYGAAVSWLEGRLHGRRKELLEKIARKRSPEAMVEELGLWRELEAQMKEAEPAARGLAQEALPGQLDSFREGADRLAEHGVRSGGAGEKEEEDDVHQLRISGKLLRYTLELGQPLGYAVSRAVMKTFKKMQEALGLWHDYVVLSEEALRGALEEMLATTDPRLYGQALELARVFWQRSERHLGHFRELWRKEGEEIARRIEVAFELGESSGRGRGRGSASGEEGEGAKVQAEVGKVGSDGNGNGDVGGVVDESEVSGGESSGVSSESESESELESQGE